MWLRISAVAVVLAALVGFGVYRYRTHQPDTIAPIDFTDDLRGPTSSNLSIPFDAYSLTPEGLLRSKAATGRSFGSDRLVVRTLSGGYASRDFGSGTYVEPSGIRSKTLRVVLLSFLQNFVKSAFSSMRRFYPRSDSR